MKRFTKHLIVRYIIAGGTSAAVNLGLLSLLYYVFDIYYLYASIFSSVVAFFVSLTLHKFWTFQDYSRKDIYTQIGKYSMTSLFGLLLNTTLLYVFVDHFHFFVYFSQILAGGLVAGITFFISRSLVFKGKTDLFSFNI
ncbi:MAG: GtrA family protein [Candidatus Zambryskibacteria bacterium]|nr:GtrA family protein [Candidatus Zambryskibacteria bacterium]